MLKILIVDDEEHVRESLRLQLESISEPMLIQTAEDGEDALEKLQQMVPDILFTDIRMPRRDGLSLLDYLKQHEIHISRIYLLTGYAEFAYAQKAIRLGVSEYLLKPVNTADVIALIRNDLKLLQRVPDSLLLAGQRLHLLSDEEDADLQTFCIRNGFVQIIAMGVYMEDARHLPDSLKWELSSISDLYVITLPDKYYRGILIGLRKDTPESQLYHLKLIFTAIPSLTVCYCVFDLTAETPWFSMFDKLVQSIMYSISLGEPFFSISETNTITTVETVAELEHYLRTLHQLYATEDYEACCEAIVNQLKLMCLRHRTPESIRMAAASSLFKLNITWPAGTPTSSERLLAATSRLYSVQNQRQLFGTVSEYFSNTTRITESYSRPVVQAIREVRFHYAEVITLQSISTKLRITPQYLNRMFVRDLSLTFSDYLSHFRLDKACELLQHSDGRINQIAQNVGYADAKYFCTLFKRVFGVTPGQYRETHGRKHS